MKKFFSLIAAATLALTAMATDYTGTLAVTVNGETTNVPGTSISVTNDGSNYTLSVINFMLPVEGGDPIGVGTITLSTQALVNNNLALLKVDQNITIAEGSDPNVEFWMGPMLGDVPIKMTSLVADKAAYVNIDIELTEMEQTINVKFLTDGFQIPNSDFEDWEYTAPSGTVTTMNEPRNWHGFKSAKGLYAGAAKGTLESATDKRPGSTGTYSAVVTAASVFGVINNGTITNGRLNAASMSAANTANHSEMDKTSTATDQYGDKFYTHFIGRPDAVKTWIKFTQGTAQSTYKYANFSTIIFDGSYYQDPEDKTYTNVTAKAQNKQITTCGWTELTVPFTGYTSVEPEAILLTVSTNATPGKGSKGDKVWIDDMEIVYNGEVTGITVNGLDGFTFDAATTTYTIESNAVISESDITVEKTGLYSHLFKSVEETENGQLITVIVAPNDMSKLSMYTINVTRPIPPLYVLGEVNGNNWDFNVGAEMTYNAETEQYELDAYIGLDGASTGYFSLTKGFGSNWPETNEQRLGGVANAYTNFVITAENQNLITLAAFDDATDGTGKTFAIPAGQYKLIVDKAMTTLKVEGDIVVPSQELYVIGSFNDWDINNPTALSHDGDIYTVTLNLDKDAEFKFVGQTGTWDGVNLGANADGDTFWVTPEVHESLMLTDSGKNFKVKKAGTWTLTVDLENKLLTVDGDWSTPLAETLQGENVIDRYALIGSDMAVVLKCDAYAILSDGNNWLKVQDFSGNEGDVVTNVAGYIEGLDLNPVMTVSGFDQSKAIVDAEPTKMDFAYATYDTMKQLKSNQVIELVGYYKDGYIYQAAKGYGMHIAVSTDNMSGNFAEGEQQHFTGVVNFKEAWTPANGAPARISQDSDDAYTNITFDVTEAGTVTGVNTVKAFNGKDVEAVYNVNGQRVATMGKGVYILRHTDGTTSKVLR